MLERKEQVVGRLLQAMRTLGLKERGRVEFAATGYDFSGVTEQYQSAAPDFALRWTLEVIYPVGNEKESKKYKIEIATVDFENEQQVTDYIIRELRRQMEI